MHLTKNSKEKLKEAENELQQLMTNEKLIMKRSSFITTPTLKVTKYSL